MDLFSSKFFDISRFTLGYGALNIALCLNATHRSFDET